MPVRFVLLLFAAFSMSGCSVFMAASSQGDKDVQSIAVGAHRSDAEQILGKPMSVIKHGSGDIATYVFVSHDEKSYGRAATYALLDGLTLGLAELVTFPVEALQGRKNEVKIIYDRQDRVKKITHIQHEPVVEKPEKTLGIEEEPGKQAI